MSLVPFFTTINYRNETNSFFQSLQNFAENYFSIEERAVVVIQSDGITALPDKYIPTRLEITLKALSYATLVIPLIVLIGQIVLRLYVRPVVWMQSSSSEFTKMRLLPSQNNRMKNELGRLFQERTKQLYWIPHPVFKEKDLLRFPHQRVNFFAINRIKDQVAYFGKDKLLQMLRQRTASAAVGDNDFLKWLNGDTPIIDEEHFFQSRRECFMNCCDFIYLALYQAGLISKEKIASIYRNEIAHQLNGVESSTFYGLDLNIFKDFDPKNGLKTETPKPGDLLIGLMEGKPVHVLFLSGKNLVSGQWRGTGLWNMANETPTPCDIELNELQKDCHKNHQILTFKYCSLETVLATLDS